MVVYMVHMYLHNIHLYFYPFFLIKNLHHTSFMSVHIVLSYPAWTMICLTSPSLLNIQAASMFALQIILQKTFFYINICVCVLIYPQNKFPAMAMLDQKSCTFKYVLNILLNGPTNRLYHLTYTISNRGRAETWDKQHHD